MPLKGKTHKPRARIQNQKCSHLPTFKMTHREILWFFSLQCWFLQLYVLIPRSGKLLPGVTVNYQLKDSVPKDKQAKTGVTIYIISGNWHQLAGAKTDFTLWNWEEYICNSVDPLGCLLITPIVPQYLWTNVWSNPTSEGSEYQVFCLFRYEGLGYKPPRPDSVLAECI